MLRLEALVKYIPEAKFIIIHRKPIDIAHSILSARLKQSGSYESWFSVKPEGWEKWLDKSPIEQVVHQIKSIQDSIESVEKDNAQFDAYHLNYEDFCASPNESTSKVLNFLSDRNIQLEIVGELPKSFAVRSKVTIDDSLYESLKSYLAKHPITQ